MRIKAVLFDLGNTLVESRAPEATFYSVLKSLGIRKSVEEVKKVLEEVKGQFEASKYNSLYGKVSYRDSGIDGIRSVWSV